MYVCSLSLATICLWLRYGCSHPLTKNHTVGVVVLQKLQLLHLYSDKLLQCAKLSLYIQW